MSIKPILFNTEMVRAILDGRKTVTRRLIKIPPEYRKEYQSCWKDGYFIEKGKLYFENQTRVDDSKITEIKPKYQQNDILYVRETWLKDDDEYYYRADFDSDYLDPCETLSGGYPAYCRYHPSCDGCMEEPTRLLWRSSIHMPKKAARIWLKVTNVRLGRLQTMMEEDALKEGAKLGYLFEGDTEPTRTALQDFKRIWNSAIKKKDLPLYGWDANPWVWLIEFERIERGETNG